MVIPEFKREHPVKKVADHEILLSFNTDGDAESFELWLHGQGFTAYEKFSKTYDGQE